MCMSNMFRNSGKKGEDDGNLGRSPHDYSHIFNDIQTKLIIHRALLLQRLVQDPFYRTMNLSSAARTWMLRTLPHLAVVVKHRYRLNLLQFLRFMGRSQALHFLRYKNAPEDIITKWNALYPPRRTTRVNYKRCAVRVVKNHEV